jgi:hypothetical protein
MAYLHLSGKVPNTSDELNTKARGLLIILAQVFKILLAVNIIITTCNDVM